MQKMSPSRPNRSRSAAHLALSAGCLLVMAFTGAVTAAGTPDTAASPWPGPLPTPAASVNPGSVPAPAVGQPNRSARSTVVDYAVQPAMSPDGSIIAFAWAGDIWYADSKGGSAQRLTSHSGDDRRPQFSPDGSKLAFESDRDGGRNLFCAAVINDGAGRISLGSVARATFIDRGATLTGWTNDSKSLLFSGNLDATAYRGTRMYSVPCEGGPITRLSDAIGAQPRMSSDGGTVVFHRRVMEYNRPKYSGSAASDIWTMRTSDGTFVQRTQGGNSDGDGVLLPDGRLLFASSRSGAHNVWAMPAGETEATATQMTFFDAKSGDPAGLTIGHGVRELTVSASGNKAAFVVWDTLYTLDLTDANAKPVAFSATATLDEALHRIQRRDVSKEVSEHALSPDGKTLAVIARGEVFVRAADEGQPTRRITATTGRERSLVWSPDNRVLWFTSDEDGSSQIYYATVAATRSELIDAVEGSEKAAEPEAKEPSDADKSEKAEKPEKAESADKSDKSDKTEKAEKSGKKKVDHAKRWTEALRFTVTKLDLAQLSVGRQAGQYDGILGQEVRQPVPSPDGTKLLFVRGLGDLVLIDLRSKSCRVLIESWADAAPIWAADSRHVVLTQEDEDFNSDIFLLDTQPAADGTLVPAVNLTRHPDNDDQPSLSADGKVLYFRSERARSNDETQIFSIFLDRKLDGLRPYELEDYFKKAGEAAKKRKVIDAVLWDQPEVPVVKPEVVKEEPKAGDKPEAKLEAKPDTKPDAKPDAGDAAPDESDKKSEKSDKPEKKPVKPVVFAFDAADSFLRIRKIGNVSGSVGSVFTTPAGDRVLFTGGSEGEPALSSLSYKGDDRKVVSAGATSDAQLNFSGDRVSFVRAGVVSSTPVAGGKVDVHPVDAVINIDLPALQRQKFREVARIMGNGFYHPTLKGLNWKGLTERYLTLVERARTTDEFDRTANMLMGELDSSHTGVRGPAGPSATSVGTGYLGIDVKLVSNGYEVTKVLPQSPADRPASRLNVGDIITAIEGKPLVTPAGADDFFAALAGRAGKETIVECIRKSTGKATAIIVTPTSSGDETDLRYQATVLERRARVEELSGGKLGYLHIRGMSAPYVRDFERDLFAAGNGKRGIVIDVRDNGGGSTADILLASLTAPQHAFTANRGVDPTKVRRDAYPRDRRLIYGYGRPISLLINETSFSNAEIFAHAIKTIGRGKLVGTATYGGVISTGQATLIDGTTVRTPFRGWYLPTGEDYENNGAKPDLAVTLTPADEAAGKDPQLEASVRELLGRLGD